jgi:murein DD-endopeptidase MepM/ murein hydrolase activator NlpD
MAFLRGAGGPDFGTLAKRIAADAQRIRRSALGRKAVKKGGPWVAAIALAFVLLTALPPFVWPIHGRVTSAFFFRQKPDSKVPLSLEFHRGLDIAAPAGSPVRAAAPGIVLEAGYSADLGNFVRVGHLFGFTSLYGHLSRIDVAKGRLILFRGLVSLGAVGSTGRSTGPHLHFAVQAGGLLLPPEAMLAFHSLRLAIAGF